MLLPLLARALAHSAAGDAQVRTAVLAWLSRHTPRSGRANSIGGSATLHGPTVQAGEIRGGVHFHQPPTDQLPTPTPRQLPPSRANFVDRTDDLRALHGMRAAHPASAVQLMVVSGLAGVGKTALVSRWLQECAADFPDGQLYVDLGGYANADPVTPGDVLEHFLRSIGASSVPVETAERAALWRTLTAGSRLAIMVDNALTAAQVRPLLPSGAGSLVAVASRGHLTGLLADGATLHQLQPLATDASLDLLSSSGAGLRTVQDPQAAREVVALCAYLPLALCVAAAQLAVHPQQSLAALAATLSQGHGSLDALHVDGEAAVRSALDQSYRLLAPSVASTYRCLGLLPAPTYDREMVAAAIGRPPAEVGRDLDALIEGNLLEETGPNRFRCHDLVRRHARQRGEAEESTAAREELVRRYVGWCLAAATAAEELLTPSHRTLARDDAYRPQFPIEFGAAQDALAWLDTHRAGLEAAVRHSAAAGWHGACWQLVDALWPLFLRLRPAELWIDAHRLGLAAARQVRDRRAESRMLTSGGAGLRNAGRHREAADWYARALRNAEQDENVREQAQALNGLGNADLAEGRVREAEAHFTRALALREEIGYQRGAALSRLCLGQTALARDDHSLAAEHLRRAHADLVAAGDSYDAARALAFLGQAAASLGNETESVHFLEGALEQFRASGSQHWQARTLEMLGQAAQLRGDAPEARRRYRQAWEIYRPLSPSDTCRLEARLREL
ncbi:tetratricopeptide repeat protein [Streptomyces sp. CT34]|uniref:tetratricopeptide repeat protein n=1 Tax=Streptomyces sp. CT34 TaxID=1553907 RepID=UPI001F5294B6|nr:tetratricopeptide repeat protein [Streptomyces sp. CT34]